MSLYPGLENLDLSTLLDKWYEAPIDFVENHIYYQEIANLLRNQSEDGNQFLLEFISNSNNLNDTDRLQAALRFPPVFPDTEINDLLFQFTSDVRSEIISAAIDGLLSRQALFTYENISVFRSHNDPYVRGSFLRYISHLYPDLARAVLIESLQDEHYIVRENAIDELDEMQATEAIPYIQPLINDPHLHVRQAAQTAVENLSRLTSER